LVVGIRESVLEETTVTPLRPCPIDALILAGLALRPPEPLSSHATRLGNDTLQPVVHPARRTSVSFAERLGDFGGDQLGIAFVAIWPLCK